MNLQELQAFADMYDITQYRYPLKVGVDSFEGYYNYCLQQHSKKGYKKKRM